MASTAGLGRPGQLVYPARNSMTSSQFSDGRPSPSPSALVVTLIIGTADWQAFTTQLKNGAFDLR